ncbi:MAG: hypothetical protein JW751_23965 [Polyangiaceae bacterium]|nr:hypothetical protein [Polyangiaceae bacterium]
MTATPIPPWPERLKACFRFRHRLVQVFGAPAAVGAIAAVGTAAALEPTVGLSMGVLTYVAGAALYAWFVTAGYDRRLVEQLMQESREAAGRRDLADLQVAVVEADPATRAQLERILSTYANIEWVFTDSITDTVEDILQGSRGDLRELRDRAIAMTKLYARLRILIEGSDGRWLESELGRLTREAERTEPGPLRDALLQAKDSTERTLGQWRAAIDKQRQIASVLTVIETNLQEFKLAMELRKADAALGAGSVNPDVTELQSRLVAAGDACDELIGRTKPRARTRAR